MPAREATATVLRTSSSRDPCRRHGKDSRGKAGKAGKAPGLKGSGGAAMFCSLCCGWVLASGLARVQLRAATDSRLMSCMRLR